MAIAPPARPRADHTVGFTTLEEERVLDQVEVEGELPAWLEGSLLRTGPAKFEAGERTLAHWFDGLAMLHRFSFERGRVSYANRFLHSKAWSAAERDGKLAYAEFASDPCRSLFKRMMAGFAPKPTDNANVNVARLGEEFIAMTETPMPLAFDPETLETKGLAYEAPGMATAHPHHDPASRELINFAVHFGARSAYRLYAQRDPDRQRTIASIPTREPGYLHSFGMSERSLVLVEQPLVVRPLRLLLSGRPFIENYRWRPERGLRFHVIDRSSGEVRAAIQAAARFLFHHVNAYEDGDELVVDAITYDGPEIIDALRLPALRADATIPTPKLERFRIGARGGAGEPETLAERVELPRIAYRRCNGRPYRYAWCAGAEAAGEGRANWLDRVVKLDLREGTRSEWWEEGCYPGEPVFVPEPDARDEDAGVLLSVTLDAREGTSFLLVLDSATLAERARARVPHHIPFGFHGQFTAAR
jgi:beta,beta-carotene 9',10'-dioxygenase